MLRRLHEQSRMDWTHMQQAQTSTVSKEICEMTIRLIKPHGTEVAYSSIRTPRKILSKTKESTADKNLTDAVHQIDGKDCK